jgi:hypothetical protein
VMELAGDAGNPGLTALALAQRLHARLGPIRALPTAA